MSQYFPKPYEPFGGVINVKVDLSNYATKTNLKKVTHVDVSSFALKSDLASLKPEVDKLDIDKLAPVPVDLSKLSDVIKNDVIKKTAKVDNIDTTEFVLKTTFDKYNLDAEKTIKSIADVIKKHGPLAIKSELAAVENKIPDANNLVKKNRLKC